MRPDGSLGRAGGLRAAPRSSAPSRLYVGGCIVRQAGWPRAPLRLESRGALVPSPRPSRAPSPAAGATPPDPLGAAWRPSGRQCGAMGRRRLWRRRRTPHSVGPLSCPPLLATSLRAGGCLAGTLFRPSRLGAALRPSAPPCGPCHRVPLPSPRPRLSSPACPPAARCRLRVAPCLARALLGQPAGALPSLRALLVLRPFAWAGPGRAPHWLCTRRSQSSGSGGPPCS